MSTVPALRTARAAALALAALVQAAPAGAGDRPGDFDFYVLSLSWSPSYCEAEGDRRRDAQCERPFSFVVHGLWPQRERGYPADCPTAAGRLPDALIRAQLDIFPAFGLIIHQWRKHGTCSGLTPADYFKAARRAYEAVRVPAEFERLASPRMVGVGDVEDGFRKSNPGLDPDEMAVTCDDRRLREIRICFTRDLSGFRSCPEVDGDACRRSRVFMPAVRGGR
ncbi:ribonuclease T2 [Prosthecomicrobium sp. N25]|uniref:ribonuclease T2 n=1 Tax=Prosthecomicrobium sp. N25 TaxID=3129254 RepID=UPI003077D883